MSLFEVIPAVDIKDGKCVQLRQGKEKDVIFSSDDPVRDARRWIDEGATRLHVIDLDAAFRYEQPRRNFSVIRRIVEDANERGVRVQAGGGIRSYEDVASFIEIGVDRVIIGTLAMKNRELTEKLVRDFSSERIMAALDARGGEVMINGWKKRTHKRADEAARELERIGIGSILFTNIDVEGRLEGVKKEPIMEIVRAVDIPVIASGGVTTIDDIRKVREAGAKGVVIGSALYSGKIKLREALTV